MNEDGLNKLLGLKDKLKRLKEERREFQLEAKDLNKTLSKKLQVMNNELSLKRAELLADKELRAEHGFSNQKDWQNKINNDLTKSDAEAIDIESEGLQKHIDAMENQIGDLSIEIDSIQWELRIYLEYYHTEE